MALVVALVLGFAGCATPAQETLHLANEALQDGRPLDALIYATEALLQDEKLTSAKAFLRDHGTEELAAIEDFLAGSAGTTDPGYLERRYDTYGRLTTLYDNLEQIGLPITEGQKLFGIIPGWEWTTPMRDYRSDLETARAEAREGFLTAGYDSLDEGNVAAADELFGKAVTKFADQGSEQQASDRIDIGDAFADFGDARLGSNDEESLLVAIAAFELAESYDGSNESYPDKLRRAHVEVSQVYLDSGLALERRGDLESLTEAVSYFEMAIGYNADNESAVEANNRARNSIADIYYTDGVQSSEAYTDPESVAAAIVAFESAQEWVPEYRDAALHVHRLNVADKLITFTGATVTAREEFSTTSEPILELSSMVNNAHEGMERLNFIADKIVQLDRQLLVLDDTLTVLGAVPVVGTAIRAIATPITYVREPVHASAQTIDRVRRPFITPSRELLASTKEYVDRVVEAIDAIDGGLSRTEDMGETLYEYVAVMEDTDSITVVREEVVRLTGAIETLTIGLRDVNEARASATDSLADVSGAVDLVNEVSGGIERLMRPLDRVKGVTDRIHSALTREISIPFVGSFSVSDALGSSRGVVARAARAIIDPILDALDIDIPSLPGIDELKSVLDSVEGYHADIVEAADAVESAVGDVVEIPGRIDNCIAVIVEETGYQAN